MHNKTYDDLIMKEALWSPCFIHRYFSVVRVQVAMPAFQGFTKPHKRVCNDLTHRAIDEARLWPFKQTVTKATGFVRDPESLISRK